MKTTHLPDNEGAMNRARSDWAEHALREFCLQTGQGMEGDGLDEIIGDLLCDLMHYCRQRGIAINFRDLLHRAECGFAAEIADNE